MALTTMLAVRWWSSTRDAQTSARRSGLGDEVAGAASFAAFAIAFVVILAITLPYAPLVSMALEVAPYLVVAGLLLALLLALLERPARAAMTVAGALALAAYVVALVLPVMATGQSTPVASRQVKLITFNILGTNSNGAEIADFLSRSDADVVFVLEAAPVFSHLPQLHEVYPYQVGCQSAAACDSLLLSRHELSDGAVRSLSHFSPSRYLQATVDLDGERLTLVNVHLTKPYFDAAEQEEIAALVATLGKIAGPVVVAGDFNSAPWSPPLVTLTRQADLRLGPHLVATWPVEFGPLGIPIDHVLTRGTAGITQTGALPSAFGSNHRGIAATIALSDPP